jgi:hypothetical protein
LENFGHQVCGRQAFGWSLKWELILSTDGCSRRLPPLARRQTRLILIR